ncbi:neutral/alkaline non-lysosomal ceramidase N-terminal domain-containing protein [Alicyclobacillus tolerans]|uniref:neutral/alkaline non-lysosomal ceramidase N-terminal domain-containing protein n=1 Tax=Alicyclobacillus tolerans TaxID=90970 RepID=UPI001F15D946|nr:neutral/alkaline non-lysosomal ceramidase N-terminal domain-containing protein [Alicyclobacillus tolerans]MCF8566823.1 neutral/alkaline non-lysosomal ceramidase N-terminal domain-containing protein [Alicyclobacillus tolerans]
MLRAGSTSVDITPPLGVPIGGNVRQDKAARGVHDPLQANILVVESQSGRVVLIGLDLLGVTKELVDSLRAEIDRRCGIDKSRVMVWATHTHSGPDITSKYSPLDESTSEPRDAWLQRLPGLLASGVEEAAQSTRVVHLRVGSTNVNGLSFNRRLLMQDGKVHMNWEGVDPSQVVEELGPVDPELWVAGLVDDAGEAVAVIVHFTLHPAILVGQDWLFSRDYVHDLTVAVQGHLDRNVPVLFANGALGNINHIDYRKGDAQGRGFAEAKRIGETLGHQVVSLVQSWKVSPDEDIRVASGHEVLKRRPLTPSMVQEARELLEASSFIIPSQLDGVPPQAYAVMILKMSQYYQDWIEVEVSAFKLGPLVWVFVPGEVFVEFGLQLRKHCSSHVVRVVSLAGDSIGYLPTQTAFEQGGYEPTFGTSTVLPGEVERLFSNLEKLVDHLLDPSAGDSPKSDANTSQATNSSRTP